MIKRALIATILIGSASFLSACQDDAQIASKNISKAADNFEVPRRVIFYNGITDEYMFTVEGFCSLGSGSSTRSLTVTCKDGPGEYSKHFLGLSDNVTYIAEQLGGIDVSVFHSRVTFKPQSIIPDVDFRGDSKELLHNRN